MSDSLRDALEKYFSNGGPDTPIRTVWDEGVECWSAPAEDIRELIAHEAARPVVDRDALEDIIDACGTGDLTTRRATDAVVELFHRRALASGEIAAELARHGTLVFDSTPHCPCGYGYEPLPQGGVSWDQQNKHRADAVLALLNGTES